MPKAETTPFAFKLCQSVGSGLVVPVPATRRPALRALYQAIKLFRAMDRRDDGQVSCFGVDVFGLSIDVSHHQHIILGAGEMDGVRHSLKRSGVFAVEFNERVTGNRPSEHRIETGWMIARHGFASSQIEPLDVGPEEAVWRAMAGGGALKGVVVHKIKLAIAGLGDVDLHSMGPGLEGAFEGFERIGRKVTRRPPAVADEYEPTRLAQAGKTRRRIAQGGVSDSLTAERIIDVDGRWRRRIAGFAAGGEAEKHGQHNSLHADIPLSAV